MKNKFKLLALFAGMILFFAACNKVADLAHYQNGTAPVLTASTTSIAPAVADSNNVVLSLSWTYPNHATDSGNIKYLIEIDSAGRNFTKAVSKIVMGKLTTSFLAKDLNSILLGFGFAYNTAYNIEIRVISSYANNNERLTSNTVTVNFKTYVTPPKVAPPASGKLWLNGGAATWSWTGNPPIPESELAKIDSVTYGGIFYLSSSNEFLVLGQNGGSNPYDQKYAVVDNTLATTNAGGDFGYYPPGTGGGNFKTLGNASGWYKLIMNFQPGKYTISSFGSNALAQDLYITGDGTPSNWTNTPPASQKFTRLNSVEYEITMNFVPGFAYKFLSTSGFWQPQFGGSSATGGTMGANYGGGSDPSNIPTPAVAGTYKIRVNFLTNTYTVTKI